MFTIISYHDYIVVTRGDIGSIFSKYGNEEKIY